MKCPFIWFSSWQTSSKTTGPSLKVAEDSLQSLVCWKVKHTTSSMSSIKLTRSATERIQVILLTTSISEIKEEDKQVGDKRDTLWNCQMPIHNPRSVPDLFHKDIGHEAWCPVTGWHEPLFPTLDLYTKWTMMSVFLKVQGDTSFVWCLRIPL